jgi:hypothetical protein
LGGLDQYLIPPAQLDKLNAAQVANPDLIRSVGHHDVRGRNIESPAFPEKSDPLRLKEMRAYRIHGNGIGSHDKPFVRPDVPSVEEVGASPVELRGESAEDVQTGFSLHDRIGPYLPEGRAAVVVIG